MSHFSTPKLSDKRLADKRLASCNWHSEGVNRCCRKKGFTLLLGDEDLVPRNSILCRHSTPRLQIRGPAHPARFVENCLKSTVLAQERNSDPPMHGSQKALATRFFDVSEIRVRDQRQIRDAL
jgi:hypothetical protein